MKLNLHVTFLLEKVLLLLENFRFGHPGGNERINSLYLIREIVSVQNESRQKKKGDEISNIAANCSGLNRRFLIDKRV